MSYKNTSNSPLPASLSKKVDETQSNALAKHTCLLTLETPEWMQSRTESLNQESDKSHIGMRMKMKVRMKQVKVE